MIKAAMEGVYDHMAHIPKFGVRSINFINTATTAVSGTSTEKMAALFISVGFVNILPYLLH
jgi:hypothetical protein